MLLGWARRREPGRDPAGRAAQRRPLAEHPVVVPELGRGRVRADPRTQRGVLGAKLGEVVQVGTDLVLHQPG
jgi:hypothetical protein